MSTVFIFLNSITFYAWIQVLATRGKSNFAFIADIGNSFPQTVWAIVGAMAFMYFSSVFVKSGQRISYKIYGNKNYLSKEQNWTSILIPINRAAA